MSIDLLQNMIRKTKNPSVINMFALPEHIPPHIMQASGSFVQARKVFFSEFYLNNSIGS